MISFDDFLKVDIRVGRIISVEEYPEARKPSYKVRVDFGSEIGVKQSSAQLPKTYSKDELMGKQVICVVNFPPKQIGSFMSEVLILGVPGGNGGVILLQPEREVDLGVRLF